MKGGERVDDSPKGDLGRRGYLTCRNLSNAGLDCRAILMASSARFTLRMKAV